MKYIKLLLISNIISFLLLFLINSVYATAWDKAQTSKSGIVDMMEVLPEYLQVNSTAENRDFHIKRNERAIGTGTQYYFYFEGGTLTVSMTTDGIFRIGSAIVGTSSGNASYPINLAGGTATIGVLPESQGGFGTSTPGYVRQNNGSSTGQLATNVTIAGTGTDTATMRTNGVDISPTEKSYLDGLTSNIQTQINTVGTSTPTANSVVRTPSGTTTIEDSWLSNNITKLGTPTTSNITEGSNLYHTTARVNTIIGSSSITSLQVSPKITLTSPAVGQYLKIVDTQGNTENGTVSISLAFSEVTGSASASQLPTSLAGMTFTGNTNFPSGIWNSSGNVGLGTTTPANPGSVGKMTVNGLLGIPVGGQNNKGISFDPYAVSGDSLPQLYSTQESATRIDLTLMLRAGVGSFFSIINNSATPLLYVSGAGTIGVGTPTPSAQFHTTSSVRFATLGSGAVQSDATGVLSVSSDERLKNIQGTFTAGISEIMGIAPILYKYNTKSGLEIENVYAGFSAQNVMQYIPEAVGKDSSGYYTFSDRPVIAALVNSVKELQKEIEELQKMSNIALKGYNAIPITNKTKIIKTKAIKLEKIEIGLGEETHEYIEEGFEDNFWEVDAINALENVAEYEERKIIDAESVIPEWELQGTSTVLVQKTVYSFRTENFQTGTKTVLKQGIEFNKWNNKFYRKTQEPKMVYRMKSGYEFKDGKFYRTETLEEAKIRRIANGID